MPNDPGSTAGGDPGTGKATPTGTDDAVREDAGTDTGQTKVKVKIDQEEKEVTLEELKKGYQTAAAAHKRMRDAQELAKQSEEAIQFQKDFEAMKRNDEGAFRRVAAKLGWNEDAIEQAIIQNRQAQIRAAIGADEPAGSDDDSDEPAGTELDLDALAVKVAEKVLPAVRKERPAISLTELEPRLRKAVLAILNKDIQSTLQNAVDNDEILGKLMRDGTPRQRNAVLKAVRTEAQRRASTGKDLTNVDEVQALLQIVRKDMEDLGVQPAKAQAPVPGLGASGSNVGTLYHPGESPKRPPKGTDDPAYGDYVTRRIMAELVSE